MYPGQDVSWASAAGQSAASILFACNDVRKEVPRDENAAPTRNAKRPATLQTALALA